MKANIIRREEHYLTGAPPIPIVRCHCGAEIMCDSDYNECEGEHAAFNRWGQELKPPHQWTDFELEMGYDN